MQTLWNACLRGDLDEAKRILDANPLRGFPAIGGGIFPFICRVGHLEVAQWIHGLGGVDIHADRDAAFFWACGFGKLTVAQWLHGLGGVDIHAEDDEAFREACECKHLDVAQWLHGLGGVDIHADNDLVFRRAHDDGDLKTCWWMIRLDAEADWPWPGRLSFQTWSQSRDAWLRAVITRPT